MTICSVLGTRGHLQSITGICTLQGIIEKVHILIDILNEPPTLCKDDNGESVRLSYEEYIIISEYNIKNRLKKT